MKIFIGSSRESMSIMDEVAILIEDCGHIACKWNDTDVFPLGEYTYEALHLLTQKMNGAIFIFAEDDKLWYRGDLVSQPRDNVLLEYGLFSALLGRKKVIICHCGNARIASDLSGITKIEFCLERKNTFKSAVQYWLNEIQNHHPVQHWFTGIQEYHLPGNKPVIFRSSEDPVFLQYMKVRLQTARRIIMIGMGLDILSNLGIVSDMVKRCCAGECTIEIIMGNPYNSVIESRLIEEERGDQTPWVKKTGMISRLEMLIKSMNSGGNPDSFVLKVFTNYPTFALIITDEEYFIYLYAYTMLGNTSPVLCFSKQNFCDKSVIEFLDHHYHNVSRDAIDAVQEHRARTKRVYNTDALFSFAVYFIPPLESFLYCFGTKIIGFDIRRNQPVQSNYAPYVGSAKVYGIHLTVCDSLYFLNKAEVEKAVEEVRFIVKEMKSFSITFDKAYVGYPGGDVVSLPVKDPSGMLTLLHNELVHRIYRRAVATDNTLTTSGCTHSDFEGISYALFQKFKSPYLLSRYRPHFTLLRQIPKQEEELQRMLSSINQEINSSQSGQNVEIRNFSIMSKLHNSESWYIVEDIELC